MQLVFLGLVLGLGFGAAIESVLLGYSAWVALGAYVLVIDAVALACVAAGALVRQAIDLRHLVARHMAPVGSLAPDPLY